MTVRFGPWYPLDEASQHAPAGPGGFQVKLPYVVDYPTGKSAMIHYGAAGDVRAALLALAGDHGGSAAGWLARHLDPGATVGEAAATVADLEARFRQRFGAPPTIPELR